MSKFSNMLLNLRKDADMTQKELAKAVGLSASAIAMYEAGTRIPPLETLEAIADYFNVDMNYLLGKSGVTTELHSVGLPVEIRRFRFLGDIACGQPIVANDEYDEVTVALNRPIRADYCLRAKGDSMIGANIYEGDVVFCRTTELVDDGDIAVIQIDDEVTLKRVYYDKAANVITLVAENPSYKPLVYQGEQLDHVRIRGKAVAVQHDLER